MLCVEPSQTAFTRFHAISSRYWFMLPFVLAEVPGELSYAGSESDGDTRWDKVRVVYGDLSTVPADWLVLYVNAETGALDRVYCRVLAGFLRHTLWIGEWRDYRNYDGIQEARRHGFFPADAHGSIVGPLAAEELFEHVRFDNGFPPELFAKPLAAGGGSPAR